MIDEMIDRALVRAGLEIEILDEDELARVRRAYALGHSDGWMDGNSAGPDDWYEY